MSQSWFTSDEHIGHNNAMRGWPDLFGMLAQAPRPWTSLEDMTEGLLANHNSVVKPGDLVYHLGDMFWRTFQREEAVRYLNRLNGQHYYILGNHDELIEDNVSLKTKFVWVRERAKVRPHKDYPSIVLDHYAGRVWNGSHKGDWQLYGHSHGNLEELSTLNSFDVGVDANNYMPVSFDQVIERMKSKVLVPTPIR